MIGTLVLLWSLAERGTAVSACAVTELVGQCFGGLLEGTDDVRVGRIDKIVNGSDNS